MDRRTMLKSAAVVAAAIATPTAASVERNGAQGISPIRLAFDAYRRAYDDLYGPEADDAYMDWRYSPKQAEYDITRLVFWNCPCHSAKDVAEKVNLIKEAQDLYFDLDCGGTIDGASGHKPITLFLTSLRGEVSDTINAEHLDAIRTAYAEWHSEEVEEKNTREERRAQEEEAAEAEKAAARARQAVEEKARYARMSSEQRRIEDESHRALQEFLRVHRQEQDWKAANPELVV